MATFRETLDVKGKNILAAYTDAISRNDLLPFAGNSNFASNQYTGITRSEVVAAALEQLMKKVEANTIDFNTFFRLADVINGERKIVRALADLWEEHDEKKGTPGPEAPGIDLETRLAASNISPTTGNANFGANQYQGKSQAEISTAALERLLKQVEEGTIDYNTFFQLADVINGEQHSPKAIMDRWINYDGRVGVAQSARRRAQGRDRQGRGPDENLERKFRNEQENNINQGLHATNNTSRIESAFSFLFSTNIPKGHKYTHRNNYVKEQMDANGSGYNAPNTDQIETAARRGQILGQILGSPGARRLAQQNLSQLTSSFRRGGMSFQNFTNELDKINALIADIDFKPGFNRTPQPAPRKYSLDQLLGQNLLRPGDEGDTFKRLYGKASDGNRAKAPGSRTLGEGIIAGVGLTALEEPEMNSRGNINPRARRVHNFNNDETQYNLERQDRGFTDNIDADSTQFNPAVIQSNLNYRSPYRDSIADTAARLGIDAEAMESIGLSENQFFPFMMETENRGGSDRVKQYCFLQAALASINETYNPNWSSKAFFGRTEEIHTYRNTNRVLDLRFVCFASSARQLQQLYERVNWLAQQTYGSYDFNATTQVSRINEGPLIRVTIGDQFQRVPGFIRNLGYNWDYMGPGGKWEITRGLRMIQAVEVSLSVQVIHAALPDRDFNFYWGLEAGINGTSTATKEGEPGDASAYNRLIQVPGDRVADGAPGESYAKVLTRKG